MENKTSKYFKYAIGEIILVVIGILIALQINNWNENKRLLEKQNLYLKGLKQNLLDSKKELSRVINECNETESAMHSLVTEIRENKGVFDKKEMDSLIMSGMSYTKYQTRQGVIDELISSGQVSIIRNDFLRSEIASWNANLINIREMEEISKSGFYDYGERLGAYFDFSGITLPDSMITENKKRQFFDDLKTRNTIANITFSSKMLSKAYKEKEQHIDTLLDVINNELSKHND